MEKGAKMLLMRRQKRIIYIGAFIIVILITLNVLSYSAPTESTVMSSPISVEYDQEHAATLEKQLRELSDMHASQQEEMQNLRDTVQRLDILLQSKSENSPTQNADKIDVDVKSDDPSAEALEGASSIDLDEILRGIDDLKYPEITISNEMVSDTPSSPDAVITRDIDQNAVVFEKAKDSKNGGGAIHGTPLLLDFCMKSLTEHHELDVLSAIAHHHNGFVPWFWSRESIGAALQNKRLGLGTQLIPESDFDNSSRSIFVVIQNSAISLLKAPDALNRIDGSPNTRFQSDCGWTIVQHPVRRFIAAYIRSQANLWKRKSEQLFEGLTFDKVSGDLKGRLKAFTKDLIKYHYSLISADSEMWSMATQTAQMSLSQIDIQHILKVEDIDEEYVGMLSEEENGFCMDWNDHSVFEGDLDREKWSELQHTLGVRKEDLKDNEFRKWIGLPTECGDVSCVEVEELVEMDILYVLDILDYEIYSELVHFYWQDFQCFNYAANYHNDVLSPLISKQDDYPGFPVRNRTKTTWDLILEYHHSKHR